MKQSTPAGFRSVVLIPVPCLRWRRMKEDIYVLCDGDAIRHYDPKPVRNDILVEFEVLDIASARDASPFEYHFAFERLLDGRPSVGIYRSCRWRCQTPYLSGSGDRRWC